MGRIIDDFSLITVDSTTADKHKSTLGTGTDDLGDDTGLTQTCTMAK